MLFLLLLACSAAARPLNIALHAQSNFAMHGFVAGSEITTAGLRRAFRRRNAAASRAAGGDGDEGVVKVFAPFSYAGLTTSVARWDLAIVEGWTGPVPRFIASVRRHSPGCVVLYWCLDT